MWCRNCQQEVPALNRPEVDSVVCARCHRELQPRPKVHEVDDRGISLDEFAPSDPSAPPVLINDPQLDREMRNMRRTLRHFGASASHAHAPGPIHFDPSLDFPPPARPLVTSASLYPTAAERARQPEKSRNNGEQRFAWFMVTCGVAAFLAGLGTIGCSLAFERPELWDWGVITTFSGQGLLIFGLVAVLGSLWTNGRQSTRKLQEVNSRLVDIQRTSEMIAGLRNSGTPSFYTELARGSSPEMLVANLKGQLDQLATRLHGEY
jgi:hypothetical protein